MGTFGAVNNFVVLVSGKWVFRANQANVGKLALQIWGARLRREIPVLVNPCCMKF